MEKIRYELSLVTMNKVFVLVHVLDYKFKNESLPTVYWHYLNPCCQTFSISVTQGLPLVLDISYYNFTKSKLQAFAVFCKHIFYKYTFSSFFN